MQAIYWRDWAPWLRLTFVLVLTLLGTTSAGGYLVAQAQLAAPVPVAFSTAAVPLGRLPVTRAPGYCGVLDGVTQYEQLIDVQFKPKEGVLTLSLSIRLANPQACTDKQPCLAYDAPEYVHAWIDWNGDQQWAATEQVVNTAFSAAAIDYHGMMTINEQVRIPVNSVDRTWLRANLAYGYDAADPCAKGWRWGNVIDKPVAPKFCWLAVRNANAVVELATVK